MRPPASSAPAFVTLHDSKNPHRGHLTLYSSEWAAFLGAVRREGRCRKPGIPG
ncbi:DUF397 domain-containing protein [Marinactinospora rubrisoli]|uniref:DUF397 domain-containing protein n=1 Tax=Marinactinospora rubrisoli TaxID=2715399 RepID=A0ABW2KBX3_9ACTN